MAPSTERRQSSAEQPCLRAVAAATRPWPRDVALRATTGLALLALGSILLFATRAPGGVVNVHVAGIVLMVVGTAWLWIPVRDKRALLGRMFESAMAYVSFNEGSEADDASCSLSELLGPRAAGESTADSGLPAADVLPVNGTHD